MHHTATHSNTLQYIATHCTTLHHTAPHCTTPHQTARHSTTQHHHAAPCNTLQHPALRRTTLYHTAQPSNIPPKTTHPLAAKVTMQNVMEPTFQKFHLIHTTMEPLLHPAKRQSNAGKISQKSARCSIEYVQ